MSTFVGLSRRASRSRPRFSAAPGTGSRISAGRPTAPRWISCWKPRAKPAWAIEIKYGSAPRLTRSFHTACDGLQPEHAFVVHSGDREYPIRPDVTEISLAGLANRLASGDP